MTIPGNTEDEREGTGSEPVGAAFPILPSHDIDATVTLFEHLGFEAQRHPGGGYAIVRSRGIELHFIATEHLDPWQSNGMAFVRLRDARSLYAELEARGALPIVAPGSGDAGDLKRRWDAGQSIARMVAIEDKPWGQREFAVLDPSNNLIRFGQPIG